MKELIVLWLDFGGVFVVLVEFVFIVGEFVVGFVIMV